MVRNLTQRAASSLAARAVTYAVAFCAIAVTTGHARAAEANAVSGPSTSGASTNSSKRATTTECVDAHASGQELRNSGQLLESRAQLLRCSREVCPDVVRTECLSMLDTLREEVPTAVLRVTVDGAPRADVEVVMDGKPLFSEVPPRAFDLNPGSHRFVFKHGQLAAIERDVTITEGDKLVSIVVHFTALPATDESPVSSSSKPVETDHRATPLAFYVLSGVGIVGLGGFVGFGLATRSKENELRSTCSPGCSQSAINGVVHRATIADISLGVGAAALAAAAATYLFFGTTESAPVAAVLAPKRPWQPQLQINF